jgi:FKBP-type peptidyl-prolyl cis-trans isomerase FklB
MTEKKKPETYEQKVSYGFGWQFGRQMHKNMFEGMDVEMCVQALRHCFSGEQSMLTDDELNEAYDAMKDKRKDTEARRKTDFKALCETFLQENSKRVGVTTTDSGLQFEILEVGDGPTPSIDQSVLVHYHGSFIDGQVFDSSVTRNEPAEFSIDQVIPGWTEALLLMPQGSKWRVAIPYQLAYGEMGAPPAIPPFAALIFEMHLIKVVNR